MIVLPSLLPGISISARFHFFRADDLPRDNAFYWSDALASGTLTLLGLANRTMTDVKTSTIDTVDPVSGEAGNDVLEAAVEDAKAQKKARKQAAREAVMSQFDDARPSDVSKKIFVANSPLHGKGLFAAQRIKKNTVLGRLVGMPTFDDGIYVLWITDEIGLELINDFKYINHGKKPNAAYTDIDVTVLKDVEAGEELLHDYGW